MKNEISKFEQYPLWVTISPEMINPNEIITIYEGLFTLKKSNAEISIFGKLDFKWFPSKGVYFQGNPTKESDDIFSYYSSDEDLEIVVDDFLIGKGFITNISQTVRGVINNPGLGDRTVVVEKILFSVPNLRQINGFAVRDEACSSFNWGRLILETDDYLINLDSRINYGEFRELLRWQGGYFLFYGGEMIPKSGSISLDKASKIFRCLNTFLSFLQGGRTSALFQKGIFKGETIWQNYPSGFVQQYKDGVFSWIPHEISKDLTPLWGSFYSLWFKRKEDDFLNTALHWYIEANNNSGFIEGSLIMAQNALELIYNWWIVEEKNMLGGKDAENISAANKIRLVLSQLTLGTEVPGDLSNLRSLRIKEDSDDAPEKIVQIRNAIVHSQKKKREDLKAIPTGAKYEGLQLSLYYIELALLKILGYNGNFIDRTKKGKLEMKSEKVPWA